MVEVLRRELLYLGYYLKILIVQISPYWIVGIILGSVISVFAKNRIHGFFLKLQNSPMGTLGIVPAALLGMASPLCMYGTVPVAASFRSQGMREDWLAAFMMSSMLLNPQLLVYSSYLGRTALIVRFVSALICGVVAGLVIRLFYRDKTFFDFTGFQEHRNRDTAPNPLIRLFASIWRNIKTTGPYFLIGIILTALYQRYVPSDFLVPLFGRLRGLGVLMAAALGVPAYACGGGTIPLIMEWLYSGMSLGAATAFMMSGPATKITNLGAVKMVLGTKRFLLYLGFVLIFATVVGFAVDALGILPFSPQATTTSFRISR